MGSQLEDGRSGGLIEEPESSSSISFLLIFIFLLRPGEAIDKFLPFLPPGNACEEACSSGVASIVVIAAGLWQYRILMKGKSPGEVSNC